MFSEFREISAKEWKQKIQVELKGEAYESLIFHSNEHIDIKPFYHGDDIQESYMPANPENWFIFHKLYVKDAAEASERIEILRQKGIEAFWLVLESENINWKEILNKVNPESTPVLLGFDFLPSSNLLLEIDGFLEGKTHRLSLDIDPIGRLANTGNWFDNKEKDFDRLKEALSQIGLPSTLSTDIGLYHNAGANSVQQLAYALGHITEYLNFINNNFPEKGKSFRPVFKVAVGGNYFFEIAKLKTLRTLYSILAKEFGFSEEVRVLAFPATRNKTLYSYNVNLLRTTTECMSAILGGADGICNLAYDALYHYDNDFGDRLSGNQLLMMKNESYLDKVSNPADGSYYIESLVKQMGEQALDIFKTMEKGGGFLNQLKSGKIQQKIKESADKEQQQFDDGELILVGANQFQNKNEKMKEEIQKPVFPEKNPRKTLIEPILPRRLAEKTEIERLENE